MVGPKQMFNKLELVLMTKRSVQMKRTPTIRSFRKSVDSEM